MAKQRLHCKEVIRRINNSAGELDREVTEHIKLCPSCARAAEAAGALKNALDAAVSNDIGPVTPFDRVRASVETADRERKESYMDKVRNQIGGRPKLVVGLGLAVAVFLFITLVPFSYTITVGYDVVYSDLDNFGRDQGDRLIGALNALGYNEAQVKMTPGSLTIANLPDYMAAKEVSAAFGAVTGIEAVPELEPVTRTVSGSLYAQVRDKMKIEVDTEGKTDAEIAEEIRQKLLAEGFDQADVKVTTSGDEKKIDVSVSSSDGDMQGENQLELHLKGDDSNNISFDSPADRIEIETEGKTNEEIKAEIEAKLAAEGKEGATVEVTTDADGQREIRVEYEKEINK